MEKLNNYRESWSEKAFHFAPIVLRLGISLVFLWFGTQQIMNTEKWIGLIPESIIAFSGFKATTLVLFNGSFEIVFGFCLLLGYFTRVSAFLLAFHLFGIVLTVGYTAIGVRDFGLAMATTSIFLSGADSFSLDKFLEKKL